MNLFGGKFKSAEGEFIDDRKNFDSLVWAMVTVFQVRCVFPLAGV